MRSIAASLAVATLTTAFGIGAARADPMLSYKLFEDGSADTSQTASDGSVEFVSSDSLFSKMQLSATGVPIVTSPDLDTSSTSITTASGFTGTHSLTLYVTQTGLTSPTGTFPLFASINLNSLIGAGVTSSIMDYFDPNNAAYGTTDLVASLLGSPGGNVVNGPNGQSIYATSSQGVFSETEVLNATFTRAGQQLNSNDQFYAEPAATAVPEPASVAIFGSGLLGLALLGRRRRSGS